MNFTELRRMILANPLDERPTDEAVPVSAVAEYPEVAEAFAEPEPPALVASPDLVRLARVHVEAVRPRKAARWSTRRMTIPDAAEPRQLAGLLLGRTSLVIRNLSATVEVTLGPGPSVAAGVGWPLPAGAVTTFDHTAEVWAVTPTGSTAEVAVLVEFDVDTGGA